MVSGPSSSPNLTYQALKRLAQVWLDEWKDMDDGSRIQIGEEVVEVEQGTREVENEFAGVGCDAGYTGREYYVRFSIPSSSYEIETVFRPEAKRTGIPFGYIARGRPADWLEAMKAKGEDCRWGMQTFYREEEVTLLLQRKAMEN